MTTSLDLRRLTAALRRSAVRATFAPSIHNTQPWHFQLQPNQLSIIADSSRQLRALDPTGRQMIISCGCALFNARSSLAAAGVAVDVERSGDPARPDLVARLIVADVPGGPVDPIASLDGVIELRRTNRRQFADDEVPSELVERLRSAAAAEDCELVELTRDDEREAVANLTQRADAIQNLNPACQAERRAWAADGFGVLPTQTRSAGYQCLLLLATVGDDPLTWLRAGEALERIQLEVTRQGFAVSPMTQVVEVPSTRAELRTELGLSVHPHLLLRVGRAATTPATRRRRLVDVLSEGP